MEIWKLAATFRSGNKITLEQDEIKSNNEKYNSKKIQKNTLNFGIYYKYEI